MIAAIQTRIEIHLSMWDRLLVLFGAPMVVHFRAETDKDPGQVVKEESSVFIGESTGPLGWAAHRAASKSVVEEQGGGP